FHPHSAAVEFDVVLDRRQAQPGALFFGRVISFKDPLLFLWWNARPIVANGHLDGVVGMTLRADEDISPLVPEGVACVLQQVYERVQEMAALHEHRSEEHTSELQSLTNLVCRLLLEKKK